MSKIHSTAIISNKARISDNVEIGPYCIVGDDVEIGEGTVLLSFVQIERWTKIGKNNKIYGPSHIGFAPQDLTYKGEETFLEIGDENTIREYTTIHRGTKKGGGITRIGNKNFFMAYSHIAHDCQVGNNIIFANCGTLAGHVEVEDFSTIGAFSAIHQFCKVGKYAFLGGFTVATQDVLPFCRTVGSRPAKNYGINVIGLRRLGFSEERIEKLKKLFRILFQSKLLFSEAIKKAEEEMERDEDIEYFLNFIKTSKRGVIGR
ncbi:MAG: acyl-ACP--UDP-N-acetylglucosamine O-acyltransferase [Thermoanaerobaculia bacterium]